METACILTGVTIMARLDKLLPHAPKLDEKQKIYREQLKKYAVIRCI